MVDVGTWEKEGPMPRDRLLGLVSANTYAGLCCTLNDTIDEKVAAGRCSVPYLWLHGQVCEACPTLKVVSTMSVG